MKRRRYRGLTKKKGDGRRSKLFLAQLVACIFLVLIIVGIKKMDFIMANRVIDVFTQQFQKDYTVSEIIENGKNGLKAIGRAPSYVADRLGSGTMTAKYIPPVNDTPVASASGGTQDNQNRENNVNQGIDYHADEELQVFSIGDGMVAEVGTSSQYGKYIRINHGEEQISFYGNCTEVYINEMEKVKKGQILASVSPEDDNFFHFELWVNGEIANPMEYIEF